MRTLILPWSLFVVLCFAQASAVSGPTGVEDVVAAAPGAGAYLLGTWVGSLGFRKWSEKLFRRAAVLALLTLSAMYLLSYNRILVYWPYRPYHRCSVSM